MAHTSKVSAVAAVGARLSLGTRHVTSARIPAVAQSEPGRPACGGDDRPIGDDASV